MAFCPKCGKQVSDNAIQCTSCGYTIDENKTFCPHCGKAVDKRTAICPYCHNKLTETQAYREQVTQKMSGAAKALLIFGVILFIIGVIISNNF